MLPRSVTRFRDWVVVWVLEGLVYLEVEESARVDMVFLEKVRVSNEARIKLHRARLLVFAR